MISIRKKTDYRSVFYHVALFALFAIFSCVYKSPNIYPVAVYSAALYTGASPVLLPVLFLLPYVILGQFGIIYPAIISAVFLSLVFLFYSSFRVKIRYELLLFTAISLIGFFIIGDTDNKSEFVERGIICAVTLLLTPICVLSFRAIKVKGLKYKFSYEETVALTAFVATFGLGLSNLVSPDVFKGFAVFAILLSSYLLRTGHTTLIAAVFGLSLSIYYARLDYVAIFTVWSIFTQTTCGFSRYLAALCVPLCDYGLYALLSVYPEYPVSTVIATCGGALAFCLIPTPALKKLKETLFIFREKQLNREAINRNRVMTANRLYELSGVFTEIASVFGTLKKEGDSEEKIKNRFTNKIVDICSACKNSKACAEQAFPKKKDIDKLIDIGMAKGRVSFIDMPGDLVGGCIRPNEIIFGLNKLLAEYRAKKVDEINFKNGRDLLSKEAEGISEILRGLALDTGTILKFRGEQEKNLSDELFKNGFTATEVLIYGERESLSVSVVLCSDDFDVSDITDVISKSLKTDMVLYERADLSLHKFYLSFKKRAEYDAVFGVANCVKEGKTVSGDTHAVTKISSDKFLIALSDGMGSGKTAETVSSVSLSLIESFYKAGLNSDLILSTVNKLLAVNTEDTFTALDVAVVDLKNSTADFIKYGCPYGFIITASGIKIVEGNNLPLGILEDLSPSVCSSPLNEGDVILMLSDGISDSFGSASDLVDYLRTVPAYNPQSLAENVLNKAIENYAGEKKDDMTALAVRVFKPDSRII